MKYPETITQFVFKYDGRLHQSWIRGNYPTIPRNWKSKTGAEPRQAKVKGAFDWEIRI